MKKGEKYKLAHEIYLDLLKQHNVILDHATDETRFVYGYKFLNDVKWCMTVKFKEHMFEINDSGFIKFKLITKSDLNAQELKLSLKLKLYKLEEQILDRVNQKLSSLSK
jgi:hypothetical protein